MTMLNNATIPIILLSSHKLISTMHFCLKIWIEPLPGLAFHWSFRMAKRLAFEPLLTFQSKSIWQILCTNRKQKSKKKLQEIFPISFLSQKLLKVHSIFFSSMFERTHCNTDELKLRITVTVKNLISFKRSYVIFVILLSVLCERSHKLWVQG